MLLYFLILPTLFSSSFEYNKIALNTDKSQIKFIYVTNTTFKQALLALKYDFTSYFYQYHILPAIDVLKLSSDLVQQSPYEEPKEYLLNYQYKKFFKLAVIDFLNSCISNITELSRESHDEYVEMICKDVSNMIDDNLEYHFQSVLKIPYLNDNYITSKKFVNHLYIYKDENKRKFDSIIIRIAIDLANHLKMNIFDLLNYINYVVITGIDLKENILASWHFINTSRAFMIKDLFESLKKRLQELETSPKFFIRFHFDPMYLVTTFFINTVNDMKNKKGCQYYALNEQDLYNINENKIHQLIDGTIYHCLIGLQDVTRLSRNNNREILGHCFQPKYDLEKKLINSINFLKNKNIHIEGASIAYFKFNIKALGEYFGNIWNAIFETLMCKYVDLPLSFMSLCQKSLNRPLRKNDSSKIEINGGEFQNLYNELCKNMTKLDLLFGNYADIFISFTKIIHYEKCYNRDRSQKENDVCYKNLLKLFGWIIKIEISYELQLNYFINKYHMLIDVMCDLPSFSLAELAKINEKTLQHRNRLHSYHIFLHGLLNEEIFSISKNNNNKDNFHQYPAFTYYKVSILGLTKLYEETENANISLISIDLSKLQKYMVFGYSLPTFLVYDNIAPINANTTASNEAI
ncbi:hypothetical protein EDEG_02931 [Edhazardia aedis USNM 41457]|uniref:Uncharacterized protein n=1 Tax=Edhazardia aedis (strain USNM 41457) TaxID=1003232 RepID=J9D565_EDHAE|nr:hypothetical protein EDEG_02931 [Edhazardia aedis USNM 41457]|eukprot:EJW02669.1 hypothetical protein EDEG_02931 [Edhazardia aedis USNM 41457]